MDEAVGEDDPTELWPLVEEGRHCQLQGGTKGINVLTSLSCHLILFPCLPLANSIQKPECKGARLVQSKKAHPAIPPTP